MAANNQYDLELAILERQPLDISKTLQSKCVGVAGLGGLGSVVAENLARAGVGHLILTDFDVIEPSNLNRQRYYVDQLGEPKVKALSENLSRIGLSFQITSHQIKVTSDNCHDLFNKCDVIAECFDEPESKASLITGIRKHLPGIPVVAASGVAGVGSLESIQIEKRMQHVYLVGDQKTDAREEGHGLFASRVGVVASMQSHVIIRLLSGVSS